MGTNTFLKNHGGEIISVSESEESCIKAHDILDKAASKWVGNAAHFLAFHF